MASERERYDALNRVANDQAMELGALHAAAKRVVKLWNELEPVSVRGVEDGEKSYVNAERLAEAVGQLEVELDLQQRRMDEREQEGQA